MGKKRSKNNKNIALYAMVGMLIIAIIVLIIVLINNNPSKSDNTFTEEEMEHIDNVKYNDGAVLGTSLVSYQTYNNGDLPQIYNGVQTIDGSGNSDLDKFYKDYLGNFKSYNKNSYNIQFVDHLDISKLIGGINYLNVFYYAECDDDGNVVQAGKRHFAVVVTSADNASYYCAY